MDAASFVKSLSKILDQELTYISSYLTLSEDKNLLSYEPLTKQDGPILVKLLKLENIIAFTSY